MKNLSPSYKGFIAAAIVVLCWSGFNIVSRMGGKSALLPFDLVALRFGVAGLLMLPLFVRVLRRSSRMQLRQFLIVTLFAGLGYTLPVYTGFSFAPAAHAGVLVNGGILFATALIAWLVLGHKLQGRGLFALLIALVGIALIGLQSFSHAAAGSRQWLGDMAYLLAAISWSIAGLLMRKWRLRPIDTTAMIVCLAGLIYLPGYVVFLPKALHLVSSDVLLLQGFYQGVIAAMVAGMFYNYANQTIGPHKLSLMLALVPGLSSIAAVPLLGEALMPLTIAGVVLVTVGAVLGAMSSTTQPRAEAPRPV